LKSPILYLFVLFTSLLSQAQNGITGNPDWQLKPVFSEGFIMVHRISIGHLVNGYPKNYELNISKPSLGNKLWQLENNLPDIGITLQCLDFANPKELGYALTAAPYVEIPFNDKIKASRLVMRVCWGATYITKPFDIHTNHKNTAIGSHVNSFVQFRWFWQLKVTDRLRFEPGITFSHASNGKAKNPNLGLNIMSLSAGLNYTIPSSAKKEITHIDSNTRRRSANEFAMIAGLGINERNIGSPELKSYYFSGSYQRNVRNTHKFTAGFDVLYDQSYQVDLKEHLGTIPGGVDQVRIAARLGYAYNIGRISLPIEVGYYAFQKINPDGQIISRLGVRYYDPSGLIVAFGLRTHFAVAYTFEYGIGYKINWGKK
jgi:hypothetical protein